MYKARPGLPSLPHYLCFYIACRFHYRQKGFLPELQKNYSTSEQISEVVFEAATDGKQKLRYVAGEDAKAMYNERLAIGDEEFRNEIKQAFMGHQ